MSKAVQKRNTISQLAHVRVRAENGGVTLRGTDLDDLRDRARRRRGDRRARRPHSPGCRVLGPAGSMGRRPLTIESDERRVFACLSKSKALLPVLLEGDFPDIKAGEPESTFEIPGSDLTAMAEHRGFAMGTEEPATP